MRDEEILAMEPGEELDRKIADEVMNGTFERYSQDVSSTWKVVENLTEMGWRVDIMSSAEEENVGAVRMVDGIPVSLDYLAERVKSDELPEAVCKAALLILNNSNRVDEIVSEAKRK